MKSRSNGRPARARLLVRRRRGVPRVELLYLEKNYHASMIHSPNAVSSTPEIEDDAFAEKERKRKIQPLTPRLTAATTATLSGFRQQRDNPLMQVLICSSTLPVVVPVHCHLPLYHHPSHLADYSPSWPSLRHHPQVIKKNTETDPFLLDDDDDSDTDKSVSKHC